MPDFFSALVNPVGSFLGGIGLTAYQNSLNVDNWERQNSYNERMYNQYQSPVARYEQLKAAGMSDAAIGQALTGAAGGSGTVIQSSPMQPNNISENFGSVLGALNDTLRLRNESSMNKQQIKQIQQSIKESIKKLDIMDLDGKKIEAETNKIIAEGNYTNEQVDIIQKTKKWVIEEAEYNLKIAKRNYEILGNELLKSEYEGKLSRWMQKFLDENGIPYDPKTAIGIGVSNVILNFVSDLFNIELPTAGEILKNNLKLPKFD